MLVYSGRLKDIMTNILNAAKTYGLGKNYLASANIPVFESVANAMIVKVLFQHYHTRRNPTAYKSSRIFIYLIFQKICLLTAFLLASQAAHSPGKDLVRQNLGKA